MILGIEDASILNPLFVLGEEVLILIAGTTTERCASKSSLFISGCLRDRSEEPYRKNIKESYKLYIDQMANMY